jgi:hypothetical protein
MNGCEGYGRRGKQIFGMQGLTNSQLVMPDIVEESPQAEPIHPQLKKE